MSENEKILNLLENLVTDVKDIKETQVETNQRLDKLEHKVTNLEQKITNLEQKVTNLEQDVADLQQNINDFKAETNERFDTVDESLHDLKLSVNGLADDILMLDNRTEKLRTVK